MWKKQKATNLLTGLIVTLILTGLQLNEVLALSDKRLCADKYCKEIISLGRGIINYRAGDEGMASFNINARIKIKSKSAGSDPSLWGIEVNGREGYAPKKLIRETQIYVPEKNLKFEVNVVKPGFESPILSTSEKVEDIKKSKEESATTEPLEMNSVEATENQLTTDPIVNEATQISHSMITPVFTEIVDGTHIPRVNAESNGVAKSVTEDEYLSKEVDTGSDYVENKIGDYDDEENDQEVLSKEEYKTERSNEVNDNKLRDSLDNTATSETSETLNVKTEEKPTNFEIQDQNKEENYEPKNNSKVISSISEVIKYKNEDQENKVVIENVDGTLEKEDSQNKVDLNDTISIDTKNQQQIFGKAEDSTSISDHENIVSLNKVEKIDEMSNIEILQEPETNSTSEAVLEIDSASKIDSGNIVTSNKVEKNIQISNIEIIQEPETNTTSKTVLKIDGKSTSMSDSENKGTSNEVEKNIQMSSIEIIQEPETNATSKTVLKIDATSTSMSNSENKVTSNEVVKNIQMNNTEILQEPETNATSKTKLETEFKDEQFVRPSDNQETSSETTIIESEDKNMADTEEKLISEENKDINLKINEIEISSTSYNDLDPNLKPVRSGEEENLASQSEATSKNENPYLPSNRKTESYLRKEKESSIDGTKTETNTNTKVINNLQTDLNLPVYNENIIEARKETVTASEDKNDLDNAQPTQYNPYDDAISNTPLPPQYDYINQDIFPSSPTTDIPQNDFYAQQPIDAAITDSPTGDATQFLPETVTPDPLNVAGKPPKALPSLTLLDDHDIKENKGLFATIMGTVNNMLSINKKIKHTEHDGETELHKILFSKTGKDKIKTGSEEDNLKYCKQIGPDGNCPQLEQNLKYEYCDSSSTKSILSDLTLNGFLKVLASNILEISNLLAFLIIVAASCLLFIFGYYCFCNSSREGALLSKLNQLESSLLASHKENAILKHNLMSTRQKLASIEDNSFGSNDMVLSLRRELEEELLEKARLQEQITTLQKELEIAADAGIELNKIVAELLSTQTGDESIISSVEELQIQLNEQQNTILEINASLAEKSRENSELQLLIAEQNAKYKSELNNVQRDNDELEHEKSNLLSRLEEMKNDFDKDITALLEGKNFELKRLQNEIVDLTNKIENEYTKWQTSVAKVEALEECLKNVRKDPKINITEVIDVANVKAQLIEAQKKYKNIKEKLEVELDSRKLAENQLQIVSDEVEKLKQEFNKSEKDKLEAQTRLEVLSNYFKEKENQLQKELSLKEAMWLKQQGETTTNVDRLTAMQEEIQSLKSQNDSLRAEIEAQIAAHKAQIGTLENRAHETWLAARQSDRRYEESRAEATALRRKLTAFAVGNVNEANKTSVGPVVLGDEITNVPSPIHMESPGSPMLGRMPPPPFPPPPFMGPHPPFMGMPPPPPFVPPGEMRPAPLGRIMSPPPQRTGRFSPHQHLDYEDYMDYESNNSWHRHTYSPPPRTHRSLSPTDSRYNYGAEREIMSTYDTETDFSPPPSPRESRRRGGNTSERGDNKARSPYNKPKKNNSGNKGPLSSGSEKSIT